MTSNTDNPEVLDIVLVRLPPGTDSLHPMAIESQPFLSNEQAQSSRDLLAGGRVVPFPLRRLSVNADFNRRGFSHRIWSAENCVADNPDWVFYRDDKPSEAEVMPRLLAEFPTFRPRWEKHLEWWKGDPAGNYNDIAEFVNFVVQDLYPRGDTENLQRAFDLMEDWLANGNENLRSLITIGFLESLQNVASWQAFGREAFLPFLGPQCHQAWNEIERTWAGKTSLMEVIRAEGNKPK